MFDPQLIAVPLFDRSDTPSLVASAVPLIPRTDFLIAFRGCTGITLQIEEWVRQTRIRTGASGLQESTHLSEVREIDDDTEPFRALDPRMYRIQYSYKDMNIKGARLLQDTERVQPKNMGNVHVLFGCDHDC